MDSESLKNSENNNEKKKEEELRKKVILIYRKFYLLGNISLSLSLFTKLKN